MVERNNWDSAWSFPESQRVFPGVSQGVLVIAISVGGETTKLTSWGPLESTDVLPSAGLDPKSLNWNWSAPHGLPGLIQIGLSLECLEKNMSGARC